MDTTNAEAPHQGPIMRWQRPVRRDLHRLAPPVGTTLAATVLDGETAMVALLTTTDQGTTWSEAAQAALAADPGQSVPAALGDTGILVTDPAASRVYRSADAGTAGSVTVSSVQASDVPAGVVRLSTSGNARSAWALSSNGGCAQGKQDCATGYALAATDDAAARGTPS